MNKKKTLTEVERTAKVNEIRSTFKYNFVNLIEKKKLEDGTTYEEMAKDLGITIQAFFNYKKGVRMPQIEQLSLIQDYFDVPYDYLFGKVSSTDKSDVTLEKDLGLNSVAIENLKKINKQSKEWGWNDNITPHMRLFAINKLLETNSNILYLIGDYLSYPSKDNKYLDVEVREYVDNEKVYIPSIEMYSYRIAKELEITANEIRNSIDVAKISKDKLKISRVQQKEQEQFENHMSKTVKKMYQDKSDIQKIQLDDE